MLELANRAIESNQPDRALELGRQYLESNPNVPEGYGICAQALMMLGRLDEASQMIRHAGVIDPQSVPIRMLAAELSYRESKYTQAVRLMKEVTHEQPGHVVALLGLARAQIAAGDPAGAFEATALALQAESDNVQAMQLHGQLALHLRKGEIAAACFGKLSGRFPRQAQIADGLARALALADAAPDAQIAARRNAAELHQTAMAWMILAHDSIRLGRLDIARQAIDSALHLDEDSLTARFAAMTTPWNPFHRNLHQQTQFLAQFESGLKWFEACDFAKRDPNEILRSLTFNTHFFLHYLELDTTSAQRRYARVIQDMANAALLPHRSATAPQAAEPQEAGPRKLRVGFISGSLFRHTISKLFGTFITGLNRDQFEVSCFHLSETVDQVSRSLAGAVSRFESGSKSAAEWVQTIREARQDVLIYLDIGMHPMVQVLSTQRLAGRQYMLWGHPVSSRLNTIDAFLTPGLMERDDGDADYDEPLVRLPGLGTCFLPPDRKPVKPAGWPGIPAAVEYFVGQSAPKWLPVTNIALVSIAKRLPGARFHLTPSSRGHEIEQFRQHLADRFRQEGLNIDQHLGLLNWVTEDEYLGIAERVDINLDTPGWSGGNSSLEILWFDVPTVTLPGASMRSRHTAAMLRVLELDQLVAHDVGEYVSIAVELGRSADFRAEIRGRIRERKHRLYEDRTVVSALAEFLLSHKGTSD
jgi:predicted O-linked N-acetylglucosamine transferase (SPINDLY family)